MEACAGSPAAISAAAASLATWPAAHPLATGPAGGQTGRDRLQAEAPALAGHLPPNLVQSRLVPHSRRNRRTALSCRRRHHTSLIGSQQWMIANDYVVA